MATKPKVALSASATAGSAATTPKSGGVDPKPKSTSGSGSGGSKAQPALTRGPSDSAAGGGDVKDIWTQVIEHLNDEKKKAEDLNRKLATDEKQAVGPDGKPIPKAAGAATGSAAALAATAAASPLGREAAFLVVGSAGGGKTSLLAQYVPNKEEMTEKWVPQPTTALEYRYARASVGLSGEKEVSHFWELGGGRQMVRLLDIAITPDNIRDALVILVVDLSKPSRVVDDVQYWIETIRARAESCWTQLRAVGSDVPDRMAANAKAQFDAAEFDKLNVLALPTLIVASKYDTFSSKDPEQQKAMARTLRALAHHNGCGLVYCSVRSDYAQTVKWFISRLNRHAGNKGQSTTVQLDHRQPLSVPPGTDGMAKIGQPPKAASSFVAGWVASHSAVFPKNAAEWTTSDAELVVSSADLKLTDEPMLEPILAQKNDDLKKLQLDAALRRKIKAADADASKRGAL